MSETYMDKVASVAASVAREMYGDFAAGVLVSHEDNLTKMAAADPEIVASYFEAAEDLLMDKFASRCEALGADPWDVWETSVFESYNPWEYLTGLEKIALPVGLLAGTKLTGKLMSGARKLFQTGVKKAPGSLSAAAGGKTPLSHGPMPGPKAPSQDMAPDLLFGTGTKVAPAPKAPKPSASAPPPATGNRSGNAKVTEQIKNRQPQAYADTGVAPRPTAPANPQAPAQGPSASATGPAPAPQAPAPAGTTGGQSKGIYSGADEYAHNIVNERGTGALGKLHDVVGQSLPAQLMRESRAGRGAFRTWKASIGDKVRAVGDKVRDVVGSFPGAARRELSAAGGPRSLAGLKHQDIVNLETLGAKINDPALASRAAAAKGMGHVRQLPNGNYHITPDQHSLLKQNLTPDQLGSMGLTPSSGGFSSSVNPRSHLMSTANVPGLGPADHAALGRIAQDPVAFRSFQSAAQSGGLQNLSQASAISNSYQQAGAQIASREAQVASLQASMAKATPGHQVQIKKQIGELHKELDHFKNQKLVIERQWKSHIGQNRGLHRDAQALQATTGTNQNRQLFDSTTAKVPGSPEEALATGANKAPVLAENPAWGGTGVKPAPGAPGTAGAPGTPGTAGTSAAPQMRVPTNQAEFNALQQSNAGMQARIQQATVQADHLTAKMEAIRRSGGTGAGQQVELNHLRTQRMAVQQEAQALQQQLGQQDVLMKQYGQQVQHGIIQKSVATNPHVSLSPEGNIAVGAGANPSEMMANARESLGNLYQQNKHIIKPVAIGGAALWGAGKVFGAGQSAYQPQGY